MLQAYTLRHTHGLQSHSHTCLHRHIHPLLTLRPYMSTTHLQSLTYTLLPYLHTQTGSYFFTHTRHIQPLDQNLAPFAHLHSFCHCIVTPMLMSRTQQHTKDTGMHNHTRPLSHSPAFSSSQLCLIFLQQTKARATSSAIRQMESPTVTHRASGGNVMGCPEMRNGRMKRYHYVWVPRP